MAKHLESKAIITRSQQWIWPRVNLARLNHFEYAQNVYHWVTSVVQCRTLYFSISFDKALPNILINQLVKYGQHVSSLTGTTICFLSLHFELSSSSLKQKVSSRRPVPFKVSINDLAEENIVIRFADKTSKMIPRGLKKWEETNRMEFYRKKLQNKSLRKKKEYAQKYKRVAFQKTVDEKVVELIIN